MTQSELYQLLLDTYKRVKQTEELGLKELINEVIRRLESELSH